MTKKLKWIKTFEDIQSIAISGMYDTGASGSFGRWKNENPALELEEEMINDNSEFIYNHIKKTNPHETGSPRDAFMGISDLNRFNWNNSPVLIYPNDSKIPKLNPASKIDVKRYMKFYKEGYDFPPIILIDFGDRYSVSDGAHRLQAAINLNVPIRAYIGKLKS